MSNEVLSISDLSFTYSDGSAQVLKNISISVSEGEIVCLLGPSGCGKTTLLNMIAGLINPTAGNIEFRKGDVKEGTIGYIFQQDALFPWRTVKSNLMLARDLGQSKVDDDRLHDYLKTFHLDDSILDSFPSQLSGGMRQRVSIIQALMFDPKILLLDEPFSALDFYTKLRLEEEFHSLAKQHKKSSLHVTHDIGESIALADRVLVMGNDGTICNEVEIDFGEEVKPSYARGHQKFSQYYNELWSELESAVVA